MHLLSHLSLQTKIQVLVALGLIFVLAVFGYLSLQSLDETTQRSLRERLLATELVAGQVDQNLKNVVRHLEDLANDQSDLVEGTDLAPLQASLSTQYVPSEFLSYDLFLLGLNGRVVWTDTASSLPVGTLMTNFASVEQTLETHRPAVSNVVMDPVNMRPLLLITVPVRNRDNKTAALLGAAINPSRQDLTSFIGPLTLGQTGYGEIVDENGIVLASTRADRLYRKDDHADGFKNLMLDKRSTVAPCHRCHLPLPTAADRQKDVLAFTPLTAAPWGVALRQLEDEALAPTIQARNRMILWALPLTLIALLGSWLMTRRVLQPVQALTVATQRIARGDLDFEICSSATDEIGKLSTSFDAMRSRLKTSYQEIERWNKHLEERVEQRTRELSTILEASKAGATLHIDGLLETIVARLVDILVPADAGALFLLERETRCLTVRSSFGYDAAVLSQLHLKSGEAIPGKVFETGKPVLCARPEEIAALMQNMTPENVVLFRKSRGKLGRAFTVLCAPLVSKSGIVGSLLLENCTAEHLFADTDVKLVQAIADQVAIAIENARLYEEIQRKEAVRSELLEKVITAQEEERRRLARELHDETGQSLTALAIGLATVESALPPEAKRARDTLAQAKELAEKTLAETRRLISDLRPTVLDDLGLVPALRRHTKIQTQMLGIDVRLQVTGPRRRLPSQMESVLFRVTQEAIINAAKHAQAKSIVVTLDLGISTVVLRVEDDGIGFDVAGVLGTRAKGRGLGLLSMQERVGLLGGKFEIQSCAGQGTAVVVHIPLDKETTVHDYDKSALGR